MRAMEDPDLPEKHHSDPAAFSLTNFRPKLNEQCLNITPLDIRPNWMGKDGFQGSSMPSSHTENGTTIRYYSQAPMLWAHRRQYKGLTLALSRVRKQDRGTSGR
jgi:hypothetical protein